MREMDLMNEPNRLVVFVAPTISFWSIHGPGLEINSNSFSDRRVSFFILCGSRKWSTLLVTEPFCG